MHTRDQLRRCAKKPVKPSDLHTYTRKRNFVKNEIMRAKRNHFKKQLIEYANKPDRFWKTIKEIFPVKSRSKNLSNFFSINGEKSSDQKLILKEFCNFFSSVAAN